MVQERRRQVLYHKSLNSGEALVRAGKAKAGAGGRGSGGPTCEGL